PLSLPKRPSTAPSPSPRGVGSTLLVPLSPESTGFDHEQGLGHGHTNLHGKKKRKLVVNGVTSNDAYQAVKSWCESFGEVRKIETRKDGSLVVDWKRRSVSDTVCRVQATVFIQGAGSVGLSW
ncbi:hypothetical protein BT96DRAFT_772833, partial [Gymnopus androsaceus JB14]